MLFSLPPLDPKELHVVAAIDDMRARLSYALREPRRWVGLLRRSLFARAIQGSNTIEGYDVSLDDAVAAAVEDEPLDASHDTWRAVMGYRNAMTYILQLSGDPQFRHSTDLLRSLHYMMLSHDLSKHPGLWRPGFVSVRRDPDGVIVYEGPNADEVPALTEELVDWMNSTTGFPPMVDAAMAHLNLVMIHPFSDGNGRMARALQSLVLAREGILDPRFSSIEEYLGRNTQAYYDVLAEVGQGRWNPQRDPRPWVRFCLTAHHQQATTILRRAREQSRIWDELEVIAVREALPERCVLGLMDAAMGFRVRNATYRAAAEISPNLASRDLKLLADRRLLEPIGDRRGRWYVASDAVKAVRERAREPRTSIDPFQVAQTTLPGINTR
jgi:Fic family protein